MQAFRDWLRYIHLLTIDLLLGTNFRHPVYRHLCACGGSELMPGWHRAAVSKCASCCNGESVLRPVEAKSGTVVPCGVESPGHGSRAPRRQRLWSCGAGQGNREPGWNVSAHIRVQSIPLGREHRGQPVPRACSLDSPKAIYGAHKWGEATPARQTILEVLVLFLFVCCQDLDGIPVTHRCL